MEYMRERTNTADALKMVMEQMYTKENGDRDDARDVVFIITDGNSNVNQEDTIQRAVEVRIMNNSPI